jgi:Ca2+-transporting ATPase
VLAFAARFLADEVADDEDPMALTHGLGFVGMVGIIDPLRAEAKGAVETALRAGIDVRMITGDHAVTAQAIGEQLGLGPGAISGSELEALSDDELARRLPELHVFGRVSPEDKLRLARTMQAQGLIVAMTGDAVNDAAALKQADIGVAMGSGSEVTKQAARMVLTDDNFATLVHAVEIGRSVYDKITSYVRFQMTQLLGLVMLFVAASAFVNEVWRHPVDGAVPAVLRDGDGRGDHRHDPGIQTMPGIRARRRKTERGIAHWLSTRCLFVAAFIALVAADAEFESPAPRR